MAAVVTFGSGAAWQVLAVVVTGPLSWLSWPPPPLTEVVPSNKAEGMAGSTSSVGAAGLASIVGRGGVAGTALIEGVQRQGLLPSHGGLVKAEAAVAACVATAAASGGRGRARNCDCVGHVLGRRVR